MFEPSEVTDMDLYLMQQASMTKVPALVVIRSDAQQEFSAEFRGAV
jgi:hypothetical protein